MLMQKSYERHSSRRNRPIGHINATLARACAQGGSIVIDGLTFARHTGLSARRGAASPSPSRGLDKSSHQTY